MLMIFLSLFVSNPIHELVTKNNFGTLSTDFEGVPFGSMTPYAIDDKGRPIIYISDLALHTKNLKKNSTCSFTIISVNDKNLFNSSRITLIGKMVKVDEKEVEDVYFGRFQRAKKFNKLGDFAFYRMEIEKIYWVGGFGDIEWITLEDYWNE